MTTKKKDRKSNAKEEAKLVEDLRAFSVNAAHEIMLGFDRLRQLRDALETDEFGSEEEAQERREKSKKLAYDLAKNEIQHAQQLVQLSHAHADLLFENARKLIRGVRRNAPDTGNKPLRVIDFEIALGEGERATKKNGPAATADLKVANPFSVDADVIIKTEKFHTADGQETSHPIRVEMASSLARANQPVTLKLTIQPPAGLEVGVYFGELSVSLVGEVTERVARRAIRLRVTSRATS